MSRVLQNQQETCVLTAKSSALSLFDLASACLGVVRRRAGGSQAEGSRLPGARNRRRLGVNRQQSGGCRLRSLAQARKPWIRERDPTGESVEGIVFG